MLRRLACACALAPMFALTGCSGSGGLTLQRSESLYRRPPATESVQVGLGFFSHDGLGARRNHRHVDNFTLDAPARITGVRWWGLVDGAGGGDGLANIEALTVGILESTPEGAPGRLIHSERFATVETNPVPTGRRGSGVAPAVSTAQEFVHEIRFDQPVNLGAEATYWLSVRAARIDPDGDNWQWQDGTLANGVSYSMALADEAGTWVRIVDTDSAFEILGWRQEFDPAFDEIR